jgi:ATP-dependent protease ClpP protease subunit
MLSAQIQIFNYTIGNQSNDQLDVFIDGQIVDSPTQQILKDWFGDETSVSYKSFRDQIETISPKVLNVYVNSTGGAVSDAMAIHDYLNELETKGVTVNRRGRGIIASAATYIMMGNNSEMSENSFMMIHNIQMIAIGDINQVENQTKAGRKFNNLIRDFYANHTGNPPETISSWMNKETWMNAGEAKERGFVKNISGKATFNNVIEKDHWPFSNTTILNTYNSFTQNNSSMENKILDAISNHFNNMMEKLGLANKKDEQPVKDAFKEFADSIANAIKESQVNEESVKTLVAEAVKDLPTAETIQNSISEATKDTITVDVLKNEFKNFENKIITAIGNKVITKAEERKPDSEKKLKGKLNNKWAKSYEEFDEAPGRG